MKRLYSTFIMCNSRQTDGIATQYSHYHSTLVGSDYNITVGKCVESSCQLQDMLLNKQVRKNRYHSLLGHVQHLYNGYHCASKNLKKKLIHCSLSATAHKHFT